MIDIKYPATLTKKSWDKKKPVLAKSKKTGIGEKLDALEKAHKAIQWGRYEPQGALVSIDGQLESWPSTFKKDFLPLAKAANELQKLAAGWAAEFKKDKLIPKTGEVAASEVANAAKAYSAEILDFEGEVAKALVDQRKQFVAGIRKMLKPTLTKTSAKIDGLLKDIRAFATNPTEEKFWSLFSGDSNARGYTTGCKNWDQLMVEFPEIRDQCHKGNAMTDFFPGMQDFGANYSSADFDKKVNSKTGKTGQACYVEHAKRMVKEVPNIQKFQAAINKCLTLLD